MAVAPQATGAVQARKTSSLSENKMLEDVMDKTTLVQQDLHVKKARE